MRYLIILLLCLSPLGAVLAADSSTAVQALLMEAKKQYDAGNNEQAAAALERALRIDSRNPILYHNLAGVRLKQQDWKRAANLAAKSNALAVNNIKLQVRNWVVIRIACEGMGDTHCVSQAIISANELVN